MISSLRIVHRRDGTYLGRSIVAAGLDPDNLPIADKTRMNFGSGGNTKAKAWRDIRGSGQGIGQIADAATGCGTGRPLESRIRLRQQCLSQSGARLRALDPNQSQ